MKTVAIQIVKLTSLTFPLIGVLEDVQCEQTLSGSCRPHSDVVVSVQRIKNVLTANRVERKRCYKVGVTHLTLSSDGIGQVAEESRKHLKVLEFGDASVSVKAVHLKEQKMIAVGYGEVRFLTGRRQIAGCVMRDILREQIADGVEG
jgi:hypothetical protein